MNTTIRLVTLGRIPETPVARALLVPENGVLTIRGHGLEERPNFLLLVPVITPLPVKVMRLVTKVKSPISPEFLDLLVVILPLLTAAKSAIRHPRLTEICSRLRHTRLKTRPIPALKVL